MAQAATLSDAQIKRALRWCTTRRYVTRDSTILLFSLYTGLRAKELAALRIGDVYDAEGTPRTQFTLSAAQTKGSRTRVVFVNTALSAQLVSYAQWRRTTDAAQPLFRSQKGKHFSANTMCQLFLNELLSNLVFEGFGSCGDLVGFGGFNSVFERDACDDFGEIVKAA